VLLQAVVKQRQAEEELAGLQDALTKVVNEAGARTRQEVLSILRLLTYFVGIEVKFEVCVAVRC